MAIYEFIGAFFGGMQPQGEFERLRREAREAIYRGMSAGPPYMKVSWDPRHPYEERFVERTIYHQGGSQTVFRNYAIIVTDGRTWKAPIMTPEGRLLQIGS